MDELLSNQQELLPRRIHFLPEQHPDLHNEGLKLKFVPINRLAKLKDGRQATEGEKQGARGRTEENGGIGGEREVRGESYVWSVKGKPKAVLARREEHYPLLKWKKVTSVGCGLRNVGNTCFLNSSLQCMAYVPVLAQSCLARRHSSQCEHRGFCMLCQFERLVIKMHAKNARDSFVPKMAGLIRQVSRNFRHGRQEDAHEFVHFALEHMVKNSAKSDLLALKKRRPGGAQLPKKLTDLEIDTCNLGRAFTGMLQSQVKCMNPKCGYESNRFESFTDLSLEIGGGAGSSLEKAIAKFCRVEVLDADNMYKCSKCAKKTRAHKQFTFLDLPSVLVVHLKRFSGIHSKITKKVAYGNKLSVSRFMSSHADPALVRKAKDGRAGGAVYHLCGVLVHLGHTQHSGHYICFVKSSAGVWYEMDDDSVTKVSEKTVLSQQAYLLFYTMTAPPVRAESSGSPLSSGKEKKQQQNEASPSLGPAKPSPGTPTNKEHGEKPKRAWKAQSAEAAAAAKLAATAGSVLGKKRSRDEADVNVTWKGDESVGREAERKRKKQEKKDRREKRKAEKEKRREERKKAAAASPAVTADADEETQAETTPTPQPRDVKVQRWDEFVQQKSEGEWGPVVRRPGRPEVAAWSNELASIKRRRHYGDSLPQWTDSPEVTERRMRVAEAIDRELAAAKPAARDRWDLDYDKPKVKKVRGKTKSLFNAPKKDNPFQAALSLHKARKKNAKVCTVTQSLAHLQSRL